MQPWSGPDEQDLRGLGCGMCGGQTGKAASPAATEAPRATHCSLTTPPKASRVRVRNPLGIRHLRRTLPVMAPQAEHQPLRCDALRGLAVRQSCASWAAAQAVRCRSAWRRCPGHAPADHSRPTSLLRCPARQDRSASLVSGACWRVRAANRQWQLPSACARPPRPVHPFPFLHQRRSVEDLHRRLPLVAAAAAAPL